MFWWIFLNPIFFRAADLPAGSLLALVSAHLVTGLCKVQPGQVQPSASSDNNILFVSFLIWILIWG